MRDWVCTTKRSSWARRAAQGFRWGQAERLLDVLVIQVLPKHCSTVRETAVGLANMQVCSSVSDIMPVWDRYEAGCGHELGFANAPSDTACAMDNSTQ